MTHIDESPTDDPKDPITQLVELIEQGARAEAVQVVRELHPADQAGLVASVDTEIRELIVQELASHELAAMLEYLEPHYRDVVFDELAPEDLADLVGIIPDDIAADAIQELSGAEAARVVSAISDEARDAIGQLVGYAPDTAAGRMTGQRVTVSSDATVAEVIETLRPMKAERLPTIYAVDSDGRLLGVVGLRVLLIAEPETRVADIAREVVSVPAETDQEDAARILARYNQAFLPVVAADGGLLGTLTADDLLHVLDEEVTEDMFHLAGVSADEDLESIRKSVRYRLPWLYANLLTVLLAAAVVALFEGTLAQAAVLAAFLPVVAAQGGNAGIQTVTVVVRSLALGRITADSTLRVVRHELATGLVTGVVSALAVGLVVWAWQGNVWLAGILAIAVVGDVLIGVAAGVVIPIALQSMRQDPALSAGIWLTTVTDVCGFFLYLGMATLVVTHL